MSSVTKALLVPIHLDALYLQTDRLVVEAMAEFSRLPYLDRTLKREINADNANISEEIVSQPFQSQNLNLKAGVHLHWSMPDALTQGIQRGDKTRFPALPNRWLVTRSRENAKNSRKSWVVESDYVFPRPTETDPKKREPYAHAKGAQSGSVSYFYRQLAPDSDEPFRYVGRQVPLDLWLQEPKTDDHFPLDKPLTAIGYGEIAFAAFYPNCHSVFGFHDDDPEVLANSVGYQYDIIGWHADESHDPVRRLLLGEAILNAFKIDAYGKDQDEQGKKARKNGLLACFSSETQDQLSKIIDGLIKGDSLRSDLREFLDRQATEFIRKGLVFFQNEHNKEFLKVAKLEDFNWVFSGERKAFIPDRTLYYSSLSFSTGKNKSDE